jgi:hypothetical protein
MHHTIPSRNAYSSLYSMSWLLVLGMSGAQGFTHARQAFPPELYPSPGLRILVYLQTLTVSALPCASVLIGVLKILQVSGITPCVVPHSCWLRSLSTKLAVGFCFCVSRQGLAM